MAAPAVIAYYLFSLPAKKANHALSMLTGFGAGLTGVGLGALFVAIALVTTGESFLNAAKIVVVAHLPVMIIEGIITAFCIVFLKKVRPEILGEVVRR
jgi:cobalt/nickel transport system permease protein